MCVVFSIMFGSLPPGLHCEHSSDVWNDTGGPRKRHARSSGSPEGSSFYVAIAQATASLSRSFPMLNVIILPIHRMHAGLITIWQRVSHHF